MIPSAARLSEMLGLYFEARMYPQARMSPDELRRALGLSVDEAVVFGARLVRDAALSRNKSGLGNGLTVCHLFGFSDIDSLFLCSLLAENWHQMHEEIIDAILCFGDPASVDVLADMAKTHLAYRDWDEVESLEVKCTYGLWRIGTELAVRRLGELAVSAPGPRTRKVALRRLRELARNGAPGGTVAASVLSDLPASVANSLSDEDDDE